MSPWDERFEIAIREVLPSLDAEPLRPDTPLRNAGLSSMKVVSLLVRLENTYGATFADEDLTFDAFATPDQLWNLVSKSLTASQKPEEDEVRTLHRWFADSVERWPDQTALKVDSIAYTYRQLDRLSAHVAQRILDRCGSVPPARIGLLARRSLIAYVGYLAVQRLGCTAVPLGSDFPVARNQAAVGAADVGLVLADGSHSGDEFPVPFVVLGMADLAGMASRPAAGVVAEPAAGAPAYILFTSGSTGVPKGVPVTHANVSAYLAHVIPRYELGPGARLSQNFDLTFDLSVFDLYASWGSGAAVVAAGPHDRLSVTAYVNKNHITHWLSVPSVVSLVAGRRLLRPGTMPSLRWSLFCGEPLTIQQARAWREAAPASTVENLYGPTELTVSCLEYRLPADVGSWPTTPSGTVPIGRSYPHLEQVVLDEAGNPADTGELCVRGPQRFDGYLDPEHNRGRFLRFDGRAPATEYDGAAPVPDDHWYRTGDRVAHINGQLVHLGRIDDQVKIRGYRVEPGEIEALLREQDGVTEAVVVALGDTDGDVTLTAAVTGSVANPATLAVPLRRQLADYMVPGRIVLLDSIPRNRNGKVDRRALARTLQAAGRPSAAGPTAPVGQGS